MEFIDLVKISLRVPALPFQRLPDDWEIRVLPNLTDDSAVFAVDSGGAGIGVYLGLDDAYPSQQYWLAYPLYGDHARFDLSEVEELFSFIEKSINKQLKDLSLEDKT